MFELIAPHHRRTCTLLALLLWVGPSLGCRSETDRGPEPLPSSVPIDRLAPSEPGSAETRYFGFTPPTGMRLDARFPLEVHLVGSTAPKDVASQIRRQVVTSHVQLEDGHVIFPKATLKGGDPSRVFKIDIADVHGLTRVVILDITRLPGPANISSTDSLLRAGLSADGKQLDRTSMQ